jgi:murein DD-endopeptidase MepM/ murein hydrolase activator NlpD
MNNSKGIKSFFRKLKNKYRLSIFRDESYEEVLNMKLTRLNVVTVIGITAILFVTIVFLLIAYTPIREFIPGYPDAETVLYSKLNSDRVDSLQKQLDLKEKYWMNLSRLMTGQKPEDYVNDSGYTSNDQITPVKHSMDDSILRELLIQEKKYKVSALEGKSIGNHSISQIHFFSPIHGRITNSFNVIAHHYGTDIVAPPEEAVKATLNGTVILAAWTIETGYVIQVQHDKNLISVYKHNSRLFKQVGERVQAGEPIAVIGNSGELTTGPHLHFELWYNGNPINPEDYITFQ